MRSGKKIVISIIVLILLIDIATIAITTSIYVTSGDMQLATSKLPSGIIRLILEGIILFFLYKGHKWAKWLIAILLLLAGLLSFITRTPILLILGAIYIVISIILITSNSVEEFMSYQKRS